MDGHPFQIEQNIRLSCNFEPWKLTEPHLLVRNTKVDGVCFEEGSFGLLSTPSLSFFMSPEKPKLTSVRLYFGAIFDQLLLMFIRNSWTFGYDMMLTPERVGVKTIKLSWPNKNGLNGGFEFRSQFCDFPQI